MGGDTSQSYRQLRAAGWEAYKAGLYREAAEFYRQAKEAVRREGNEKDRVSALFWEGDCWRMAGDYDRALPLLIEATHASSPDVDPADVFNARTSALAIARWRQPARLFRQIMTESWSYLERLGREQWGHNLYHLAASFANIRGDHDVALAEATRAWVGLSTKYPSLTRAGHLVQLCAVCFARRDRAGLERWVGEIETNEPAIEWDRVAALLSRLLHFRAVDDHLQQSAALAEVARSTLRRVAALQGFDVDAASPSLRALTIAGCFSEVEAHVNELTPKDKNDEFKAAIFRGDFALCRARASLGQAPRDDEWDVDFPPPVPPFPDREEALRFLAEARSHFEAARPVAAEEDARLETRHYSRTLAGRLDRVASLRAAVEAAA